MTDTTPENVFNSNLSTLKLKSTSTKDLMNEFNFSEFNESTPDLFEIPELSQHEEKFDVEEFINKGDYDYA